MLHPSRPLGAAQTWEIGGVRNESGRRSPGGHGHPEAVPPLGMHVTGGLHGGEAELRRSDVAAVWQSQEAFDPVRCGSR